ncbi:nickel pincer cofactor biosynthesis protein LarC [Thermodesulfatator atlanticus]
MPIAYLDLIGGIAGDIFLAALLDAGYPETHLATVLKQLPGGLSLKTENLKINGVSAKKVSIVARTTGVLPQKRTELFSLVDRLPFEKKVLAKAKNILETIFQAEAKVHGEDINQVHLHELSAFDTLADIFGVLGGLSYLKVEEVCASEIPLGRGLIHSRHGILPAPAPATLEILKGLPVKGIPEKKETVTPTGAALLKNLVKDFGPFPEMRISKVGYGAGHQKFDTCPNILRLLVGKKRTTENLSGEKVVELEANIDDKTPEELAFLAEKLMSSGALDVGFTPFFMKKGRPGFKLCILAKPENTNQLVKIFFSEETSLGVRIREIKRKTCPRQIKKISTPWGEISVKFAKAPCDSFKIEFEDLKKLSEQTGIPLIKLKKNIESYLKRHLKA